MAKTNAELVKAWRERQLADPEKAEIYRKKRAAIARGKKARDKAEIQSLRDQVAMTHIVHTKPGKDDMGFDVDDFANDEEARSYLAFTREAADKHGIRPVDMVSPGTFAMVLRWFKRNGD